MKYFLYLFVPPLLFRGLFCYCYILFLNWISLAEAHLFIQQTVSITYYTVSEWSRSVMSDSATPWTVACQAPLPMGLSGQEYWSGLPFPSPEIWFLYVVFILTSYQIHDFESFLPFHKLPFHSGLFPLLCRSFLVWCHLTCLFLLLLPLRFPQHVFLVPLL